MPIKPRERQGHEADDQPQVLFKGVSVFDRAQVAPIDGVPQVPLEPLCEPLTGDSHARLLAPGQALTESLGFTVSFEARSVYRRVRPVWRAGGGDRVRDHDRRARPPDRDRARRAGRAERGGVSRSRARTGGPLQKPLLGGPDLDPQPAPLPLDDVNGVPPARTDLIEHGLPGEPELAGGVIELDVPVRDRRHEPL